MRTTRTIKAIIKQSLQIRLGNVDVEGEYWPITGMIVDHVGERFAGAVVYRLVAQAQLLGWIAQ